MLTVRHFSFWISFLHASAALILVPLSLYAHCSAHWPAEAELSWGETAERLLHSLGKAEPSALDRGIAAMAGSYYTLDFIFLWCNVHALGFTIKLWYSLHHVMCFVGLVAPCWYYASALDASMAFMGFWMGEISNPPRCIVDLLEYAIDAQGLAKVPLKDHTRAVVLFGRPFPLHSVRRLIRNLLHVHLALFIAFRFAGVHFFVSLLLPLAQLEVTKWMGGATLVLSLMAAVVMIQDATKASSDPVEVAHQFEQATNGVKQE